MHNELASEYDWVKAEARLIASVACGDGFPVVSTWVLYDIQTWRKWFYGLISADDLVRLTGVRKLPEPGD